MHVYLWCRKCKHELEICLVQADEVPAWDLYIMVGWVEGSRDSLETRTNVPHLAQDAEH